MAALTLVRVVLPEWIARYFRAGSAVLSASLAQIATRSGPRRRRNRTLALYGSRREGLRCRRYNRWRRFNRLYGSTGFCLRLGRNSCRGCAFSARIRRGLGFGRPLDSLELALLPIAQSAPHVLRIDIEHVADVVEREDPMLIFERNPLVGLTVQALALIGGRIHALHEAFNRVLEHAENQALLALKQMLAAHRLKILNG